MSLYKIGSSLKILKTASSMDALVLDNPAITPENRSIEIIEPKHEDMLYFTVRAISSLETDGPNGNNDGFPWKELQASYKTFKNKLLFLNHESSSPILSVGAISDSYLVDDKEQNSKYILLLGKIDKMLHPEIARMVETGNLSTGSMGCSCDESKCSICGAILHSDNDPKCAHLESLGLGKTYTAEIDLPEYNIKRGEKAKAFAINSGISFSEFSLVNVPADPKARILNLVSAIRGNIKKNASFTKNEQLDLVAQLETILTKVDPETANQIKAEFCGCPTPVKEEVPMSDKNIVSEDQKKILSKISALEMEQLESYVAHKTKKANEVANKEVVADATKKEETFLSRIVAKVKDSFAAQLLEKKVEAVAKEELGKEAAHLSRIPYSELNHCGNCKGLQDEPETDDCSCHDKGAKNDSTEDKVSSISAKFNEDTKNVLASTWSVYEGDKLVLDASLKDIWGSQFATLSFADQKWATSEAYGKEAIARYQKEGVEKLADLWDVSGKINKTSVKGMEHQCPYCNYSWKCTDEECKDKKNTPCHQCNKEASLKTASEPKLGPSGTRAKPSTGTDNKEHIVKNSPVTKPGQETAQKGPAAPAGTDAKTDPQFKMPRQEKGQTGPASPKAKEVKTDYSEPKPEAEGKEVKTTPKNPEEKKLEKSEKEVETSYVAKGTEEMEAEEKGKKEDKKASIEVEAESWPKCQNKNCGHSRMWHVRGAKHVYPGEEHLKPEECMAKDCPCKRYKGEGYEEKKASVNYKEANAQIKWSSMTPEGKLCPPCGILVSKKEDKKATLVKVAIKLRFTSPWQDLDGQWKPGDIIEAIPEEMNAYGTGPETYRAGKYRIPAVKVEVIKQSSLNYKEANAQIKWSSMTPEAQDFIKKHVEKHIKEDGMERAQAVAAAYSEAREKGMDVPAAPKESSQETIMEKKAADKPTEAVEGSTLPDGKKTHEGKPDEASKESTYPTSSATSGSKPEEASASTLPEGKKTYEGKPDEASKDSTLPKETATSGGKPDEASKESTQPESKATVGGTPDEAVKGSTQAKAALETKADEKDLTAPPITDKVMSDKPDVAVQKEEAIDTHGSALDKAEKLDIGEGYSASKDKETKEIIISKDGKEVKRLPDGFANEVPEVLKLLRAVLGLPPVEEKKEVTPMTPAPETPKMEEAPKPEEHPALEEAHEDEMGMKESALKVREEAVSKKEAELKAIEVKAQEQEKAKKFASILSARSERCQKIVASMVDKNALQLSQDVLDSELKSGTYLLDARHKAMTHAIKAKHKELLAFDDMALKAMEKAIDELPMPSSTVNEKKATRVPYLTYDPNEIDEVGNIFRNMGTLRGKTINDIPKK